MKTLGRIRCYSFSLFVKFAQLLWKWLRRYSSTRPLSLPAAMYAPCGLKARHDTLRSGVRSVGQLLNMEADGRCIMRSWSFTSAEA